jgi:tRNA modification GTPase
VDAVLARARQGALLREGLRVVLAGQPNVGKSSCSTRWPVPSWPSSRRFPAPRATASARRIQIEGVPLHVTDTAGLRHDVDAADEVERIGIGRSWEAIARPTRCSSCTT